MRSPEEKEAWRTKLKGLAEQIRKMQPIERESLAQKIGTITCEGHPLSPFNTIFLSFQSGQSCLQVGGFRQWQKAGRVVRKGEHSVGSIFVPTGKGKAEEAPKEEGAEKPSKLRFVLIPMFDVTQTEALPS